MRSKNEQVSTGRFEPHKFEAQNQTSSVGSSKRKKRVQAETATEPVQFASSRKYASLQVQTDDDITGLPAGVPGIEVAQPPQSLLMVQEHSISKCELSPHPLHTPMAKAVRFEPPEEEKQADWLDSKLYEFVSCEHSKTL